MACSPFGTSVGPVTYGLQAITLIIYDHFHRRYTAASGHNESYGLYMMQKSSLQWCKNGFSRLFRDLPLVKVRAHISMKISPPQYWFFHNMAL